MAYDFVVGKNKQVGQSGVHVGSIEYREYPHICSLLDKTGHYFLERISDLYSDKVFDVEDLKQAQASLGELLVEELADGERALLYKLLAVIGYAIVKDQPLHGLGD